MFDEVGVPEVVEGGREGLSDSAALAESLPKTWPEDGSLPSGMPKKGEAGWPGGW